MKQLARPAEGGTDLVHFGASFVKSQAFKDLFREGMSLVEETAAYLDGEGRTQSHRLGRSLSLAYASESMRLTTRLMQIASWLLVQRAVAEGEITQSQAAKERDRVKLSSSVLEPGSPSFDRLPERLRELILVAARLHGRVVHLDGLIHTPGLMDAPDLSGRQIVSRSGGPVAAQQMALRAALGLTG